MAQHSRMHAISHRRWSKPRTRRHFYHARAHTYRRDAPFYRMIVKKN
jgi:hypothetical protein